MRMTQFVFRTLREEHTDTDLGSRQLMLRAGLVRQVAAGIFAYLPIGQRIKRRIEALIRQEMDAIGGQEVAMPVVHPAELWRQCGRWDRSGDDLVRFKDRNGRDMCLGMAHEEVVTDLVAQFIESYRQLPRMLYHIQTNFRDEPQPRSGLIRLRESTMKDGYSFHTTSDDLDTYYSSIYQAYFNIFRQCGVDIIAVSGGYDMKGDTTAHAFMALAPDGGDTVILCDRCDYRAKGQLATSRKPDPPKDSALCLEEIETPGTTTIGSLVKFLDIAASQTAKAVFFMADVAQSDGASEQRFIFAVVRGDMVLNETKLSNAINAHRLKPATDDEIRGIGSAPGFGSPFGVSGPGILVVVDDLIPRSPNLVAGANKTDYHIMNVNYGRDYTADVVADITVVEDGDSCPSCASPLRTVRGIEVGNVFKLGTEYSETMGATFLDEKNQSNPMIMGSYGIGIDRLIATVIEHHHDKHGIKWPLSVAPFQIALVRLDGGDDEVIRAADEAYERLKHGGLEVLYDDRDERAGVKFNDADLIGIPLRLTVGDRGLKRGIIELKVRRTNEKKEIPYSGDFVEAVLKELDAEGTVILDSLKDEAIT